MKINYITFLLLLFFFANFSVYAQTTLTGKVTDLANAEALVGVTVMIKGKTIGTNTDAKGQFSLNTSQKLPFTLVFSLLGYATQEKYITQEGEILVQLTEAPILGQEVVISASRVEEKILESPVAIEKINLRQLKQLPQADFYESLASLKGVDVISSSLGFKTVNVRGFAANGNQRFVQLVDGMDNNVPGLGYAAGNLIGLSELDVESMELLQGTASALYGANAISGIMLMNGKNPFRYQGVSTMLRTGVNNVGSQLGNGNLYIEGGFRYAQSLIKDKLAVKLNVFALNGTDWVATDYRNREGLQPLQAIQSPSHEGINLYGDETGFFLPQVANSLFQSGNLTQNQFNLVQNSSININRTGYKEADIMDTKIRNIKINGALHYRLGKNLEAIVQGNYGEGTANYIGGNRFCFKDFKMYQFKTELRNDNFYVRLYNITTNSGNAYDVSSLGGLLNEIAKPSEQWANEYVKNFAENLQNGQTESQAHQTARLFADRNRILPNSDRLFTIKDSLLKIPQPQGTGFIDRSQVYHAEGMYNFTSLLKFAEVITGFNIRNNRLNSQGTIFADRNGRQINIVDFGGYVQVAKAVLNNRLKFTGSVRYDKSTNFAGQFTPRLAAVYQFLPNHYLRFAYQTGFRIPTPQNQYMDLNVGRAKAIGGLPEFIEPYNLVRNPIYPLSAISDSLFGGKPLQAHQFQDFKPEKVQSFELGYRTLIANTVSVDAYYYRNFYQDFIKSVIFVQSRTGKREDLLAGNFQAYVVPINDNRVVETAGYGISASAMLPKNYLLNANISSDQLITQFTINDVVEFNTPPLRLNFGISNNKVWKNLGFSLNFRWQDEFIWQSVFATGKVPAYSSLDAQISLQIPRYKGQVKIGGSNILNVYNLQAFGNPQVGGLYYVQFLLEDLL